MPMVEVDEEQLRRDSTLRQTIAKILGDPKAKRLMEQAHKMVDKEAVTPALDADQHIEQATAKTREELDALRKEISDDKAKREQETRLNALNKSVEDGISRLRQQGWTDEGITAVRKLMEDKGIVDPEIAAAYHEKTNPPPSPVNPNGQGGPWNFIEAAVDGDADWKKLIETKGESDTLVDKMARDALSDARGLPRR